MRSSGIRKLYYSISEVSALTSLEQYVLRYWETEFEQLSPAKNRAGNRIYTTKEIKIIWEIKRLLREEMYTIDGAKKFLETFKVEPEQGEQFPLIAPKKKIQDEEIRNDLIEVKGFLEAVLEKLK
jgi:DNA-binding transcriptional MerR regulator